MDEPSTAFAKRGQKEQQSGEIDSEFRKRKRNIARQYCDVVWFGPERQKFMRNLKQRSKKRY